MPPSFVPTRRRAPDKRSLATLPFVELFGGRVQGVVSSKSDPDRMYVSWYEGGTGNFYCSTNNNRPCGGLGGSSCKHIDELVRGAIAQFGVETVGRSLGVPGASDQRSIMAARGTLTKEPSGIVFSRFLDYLRYMELSAPVGDLPELAWFVTG